jgi:hypothetical protein
MRAPTIAALLGVVLYSFGLAAQQPRADTLVSNAVRAERPPVSLEAARIGDTFGDAASA